MMHRLANVKFINNIYCKSAVWFKSYWEVESPCIYFLKIEVN